MGRCREGTGRGGVGREETGRGGVGREGMGRGLQGRLGRWTGRGGRLGRGTGTNGVEHGDEWDSYRPVDQWGANADGKDPLRSYPDGGGVILECHD